MSHKKKIDDASLVLKYDLDNIDQQIIKLRLKYPLASQIEIAKELGIARSTCVRRMHAEKFKKALSHYLMEPDELFRDKGRWCAMEYLKLAQCSDVKVKERVLRTILVSLGVIKYKIDVSDSTVETLVVVSEDGKHKYEMGIKGEDGQLKGLPAGRG